MSRMKTSISPVGSLGFTSSGSRAFTSPSMRMQYSARSFSTSEKTGLSGSQSTWVMPKWSRRSMKITPPWSRRRCTQPLRRMVSPTLARVRAAQVWLR
jgi:hypothetical protein